MQGYGRPEGPSSVQSGYHMQTGHLPWRAEPDAVLIAHSWPGVLYSVWTTWLPAGEGSEGARQESETSTE